MVKSKLVQGGDGTAISSGMAGEVKAAGCSELDQNTPTIATYYDLTGTLDLGPGNWDIFVSAAVSMQFPGGTISGVNCPYTTLALRSGASTIEQSVYCGAGNVSGVVHLGAATLTKSVDLTAASTIYKLSAKWAQFSGSGSTVGKLAVYTPILYAVRRA